MTRLLGVLLLGILLCRPAAAQTACDIGGLSSLPTDKAVAMTVSNRSLNRTYQVLWVDFEGKASYYRDLGPGETIVQPSYVSHVWALQSTDGDCGAVLVLHSDIEVALR